MANLTRKLNYGVVAGLIELFLHLVLIAWGLGELALVLKALLIAYDFYKAIKRESVIEA